MSFDDMSFDDMSFDDMSFDNTILYGRMAQQTWTSWTPTRSGAIIAAILRVNYMVLMFIFLYS